MYVRLRKATQVPYIAHLVGSPRSWSEMSAIQTVIHLDQGVNRLRGPFRMPKLRVLSAWIDSPLLFSASQ